MEHIHGLARMFILFWVYRVFLLCIGGGDELNTLLSYFRSAPSQALYYIMLVVCLYLFLCI